MKEAETREAKRKEENEKEEDRERKEERWWRWSEELFARDPPGFLRR